LPYSTTSSLLLSEVVMSQQKITVVLIAIGEAPILKQKRVTLKPSNNIAFLTSAVRKMTQLPETSSLYFYIGQNFSPSPEHTFQILHDCY